MTMTFAYFFGMFFFMNLVEGIMSQQLPSGVVTYNTTEIYPTLEKRDRIYANGGSHIYR